MLASGSVASGKLASAGVASIIEASGAAVESAAASMGLLLSGISASGRLIGVAVVFSPQPTMRRRQQRSDKKVRCFNMRTV